MKNALKVSAFVALMASNYLAGKYGPGDFLDWVSIVCTSVAAFWVARQVTLPPGWVNALRGRKKGDADARTEKGPQPPFVNDIYELKNENPFERPRVRVVAIKENYVCYEHEVFGQWPDFPGHEASRVSKPVGEFRYLYRRVQ